MDAIIEKLQEAYQGIVDKEYDEKINEVKLTKKHFIALAELMKRAKTIDHLKSDIIDWLKATNPMFDEEIFKKAAGIKNLPRTHEEVNDIEKRI